MSVVFLLGLAVLILLAFFLIQSRRDGYWKKQGVLEVTPMRGGPLAPFAEAHAHIYNQIKNAGKPFGGMYDLGVPTIVPVDLNLLRDIFIKSFDHFTDVTNIELRETDPHLYYSLFNMRGQEWKQLRAKMTPTFTTGRIRRMMYIFESSAEKLKTAFQKSGLGDMDIRPLLERFTLEVIASSAFGVETNLFENPNSLFMKMALKTKSTFDGMMTIFKFLFLLIAPRIARLFRIRLSDAEADEFLTRMVKDCIAYRQRTGKTRDDMLQLMIEAKAASSKNPTDEHSFDLTDDVIVAQSLTFILAGFDNIEKLLTFTLYELALNVEVQETLFQELKTASEREDGLGYEGINTLEYLNMVVSETLRKYPTSYRMERTCTKSYELPGSSGAVMCKGHRVMIPVHALHYDPEYWPEPEKFDPLRFTKENVAERHPMAYIPFGHGPRQCIGNRFALVEAKVAIAKLILAFKFEPCGKTEIPVKISKTALTIRPAGGVRLRLLERK